MPIFQNPPADKGGIFKIPDSEGQVDSFGNMVYDSIGDENVERERRNKFFERPL